MKQLLLIGGTMGVGKTTVCQYLLKNLPKCVFLDGDWCWSADPFQVTDETKTMVMDNIVHILNNFLHCSAYQNILLGWVMHEQSIIDSIVEKLDLTDCHVLCISLIADETTLHQRIEKDIGQGKRTADVLARSLERLPLYAKLKTVKIDTSHRTVEDIATEIMETAKVRIHP